MSSIKLSSLAKIRWLIAVFLLALLSPTLILVSQAYKQLHWESVYQIRSQAESLTQLINNQIQAITTQEESRSVDEYNFLIIEGSVEENFKQKSPLVDAIENSTLPGLVGYFQIDDDNELQTPHVPTDESYGLDERQIQQAQEAETKLQSILSDNAIIGDSGARSQIFELESKEEVVSEKKLSLKSFSRQAEDEELLRKNVRKESIIAPSVRSQDTAQLEMPEYEVFENEIAPMQFTLLESGHFIFFRRVWQGQERFIQGMLIEQEAFLNKLIASNYYLSSIANNSRLSVHYKGSELQAFSRGYSRYDSLSSIATLDDTQIFQAALFSPLEDMQLKFSVEEVPLGPGGQIILLASFVIVLVILIGSWMLYRLAKRQLRLVNQQQDFVSSVSHELKTPLTSIRMFGEMLKEGWASEEKKQEYYEFIFFESERLSRLIENVLQMAKMTRSELALQKKIYDL